jgi:hypothetical protein
VRSVRGRSRHSCRRKGIALPAVLLVTLALALLSGFAFTEAVRDRRVATLAQDAVHARAAALTGLAEAGHPPDLAMLCVSGPLASQSREMTGAMGTHAVLRWRAMGGGVTWVEAEGRGRHGARRRLLGLMVPDSAERTMDLFRCPAALRLVPVSGRWRDGHPEG